MDEELYQKRLDQIEKDYKDNKNKLYREFALSNAKFKIGDIIKDERWAFVIDKITFYKFDSLPQPVYHGFELKKDLKPKKNSYRVSIYGNDAELIKSF